MRAARALGLLPRPFSPYGVSKLAGEHLVLLYGRNFGLPGVALRYFTVYGPRQRPDMAFHRFIRAAIAGQPITLYGDGEQTRDFTFVADAVSATAEAGAPPRSWASGAGSPSTREPSGRPWARRWAAT